MLYSHLSFVFKLWFIYSLAEVYFWWSREDFSELDYPSWSISARRVISLYLIFCGYLICESVIQLKEEYFEAFNSNDYKKSHSVKFVKSRCTVLDFGDLKCA